MKLAVSGGFGFIGRHVVAELERRGVSPILIARPNAMRPAHAVRHRVVECDLRHNDAAQLYEQLDGPDTLIHLAWGGLPNYRSLHHFEDELPAQYRFLRELIGAGLRNLLVTGTCFEYGMQSGLLGEELAPLPANPYGFAKDALRAQLQYLKRIRPFNLTWARLFYLYGDGQPATSLMSQLRSAVTSGAALFDMSGGQQLRDYLPVEKVANAIVSLALTGRDNGIVNVCSGEPISVRKLVEDWISRNGWSIALNLGRHPYPDYEPLAFWGDPRKLHICLAGERSDGL